MLPVLPTESLALPCFRGRLNPRRGAGAVIPHQNVVLGHGDVVGVHGEAHALLHLRGESARLAGALAPLLPRAPGENRQGHSEHRARLGTDLGGGSSSQGG